MREVSGRIEGIDDGEFEVAFGVAFEVVALCADDLIDGEVRACRSRLQNAPRAKGASVNQVFVTGRG